MISKYKLYYQKYRSLPPKIFAQKAYQKIKRLAYDKYAEQKFKLIKTFSFPDFKELNTFFKPISTECLLPHASIISYICKKFIEHKFDLLGSGWTDVMYGMVCPGIEGIRYSMGPQISTDKEGNWLHARINHSNLSYSKKVWSCIDDNYIPIDWQLDFKSGYRWSALTWYKQIIYGHKPGVDVKVPWELARMQHLPQLAFAYILSKSERKRFFKEPTYQQEFRNQVMDFIANNPPQYGVNWSCAMDVSIRVVNWLVAYDLFKAHGATFDEAFESIFFNSIFDHGKHIAANLEYSPTLRGNHYLANIAGLLFVSAYLPSTIEIDSWMSFSVKEMYQELKSQFNSDGSNFEGSTSYHRLSTEILVYSFALIKSINLSRIENAIANKDGFFLNQIKKNDIISTKYESSISDFDLNCFLIEASKILKKAMAFILDTTGPSNQSIQIGDNDNGRFLKLQPIFSIGYEPSKNLKRSSTPKSNSIVNHSDIEASLIENMLDHRPLISAIKGAIPDCNLVSRDDPQFYEESIIRNLYGRVDRLKPKTHVSRPVQIKMSKYSESQGLLANLRNVAYPDFGLYIYRSDKLFLTIRCGKLGQNGNGGHAHNDQLSITLAINGRFLFVDTGSYLYTGLPGRRNEFRSTHMHNTLVDKFQEQNDFLNYTVFALKEKTNSRVLSFTSTEFEAEHHGFQKPFTRKIQLGEKFINISDRCAIDDAYLSLHLDSDVNARISKDRKSATLSNEDSMLAKLCIKEGVLLEKDSFNSESYGCIKKSKNLTINGFNKHIEWYLEAINQ